jgi:hypothetical protein
LDPQILEEKRGLTRRPKDAKEEGISTTENTENTEEEWLEVEGDGHDADGSWF